MRHIYLVCAAALAVTAIPAVAAAETPAASSPSVRAGTWIYGPDGKRVGRAYSAERAGVVLMVVNGELVRVPVRTLSVVDGKVATSLTRAEVSRSR